MIDGRDGTISARRCTLNGMLAGGAGLIFRADWGPRRCDCRHLRVTRV